MIVIHIMFILCPILAIVHTLVYIKDLFGSPVRGWFITYALINVMTLFYYFFLFMRFVRGITKFKRNRRNIHVEDGTVFYKKPEDEEGTNYFNIWRGDGDGPMRIGTRIDIGQNLYSLLFYSCVRKEYIRAAGNKKPK